jgi:F-type H+-transporting ATPase subunit b
VNLNATLLVQMLTFALFVWFTLKLVWPHIIGALQERQQQIAAGIAAAEKAQRNLAFAERKVAEERREFKAEAAQILERAQQQANQIVATSKQNARTEGERLLTLAQADIAKEINSAKIALRKQVGVLAVQGAERILQKNIDGAANQALVDNLIDTL